MCLLLLLAMGSQQSAKQQRLMPTIICRIKSGFIYFAAQPYSTVPRDKTKSVGSIETNSGVRFNMLCYKTVYLL